MYAILSVVLEGIPFFLFSCLTSSAGDQLRVGHLERILIYSGVWSIRTILVNDRLHILY